MKFLKFQWCTLLFRIYEKMHIVIKKVMCFFFLQFLKFFLPWKNIYLIVNNLTKSMVFIFLRGCLCFSNDWIILKHECTNGTHGSYYAEDHDDNGVECWRWIEMAYMLCATWWSSIVPSAINVKIRIIWKQNY